MIERIYLNDGWGFTEEYREELRSPDYAGGLTPVRIPHTCKVVPFHYFSETEYQMLCGYRRMLDVDPIWAGKRLLLTFEGAAHDATVYVNGTEAARHRCGYTAFTVDITGLVSYDPAGPANVITVRLDTREDLNVPPFGNVIDYLTYGGLYRDVYLEVKEPSYLRDVFVWSELPDTPTVDGTAAAVLHTELEIEAPQGLTVRQSIRRREGEDFTELGACPAERGVTQYDLPSVTLWDIDAPTLYVVRTELLDGETVVDRKDVVTGFRSAVFRKDGFYLNGWKLKIRGLNRHQSYAYQGYAMPDSMQALDADILKNELGLNAVRTSHYPQAHSFISRCDEIGLLVFTEIPGWQHIGDDAWKAQALTNVREMVLQYRNHPSIMLWGVRINESKDDDALYTRTNRLAHMLDPSRQTGGVRCIRQSSLLEDVYTFNDFSFYGKNEGSLDKAKVTPDMEKGYMVTEYNGHMFPTKSYDCEAHRLEHALRHATVIDSVAGRRDTAGSFGWCMFDYNTHQEFGSGDRICHHGVMDMFRNPKLAASVYASQQEETPVLEVSSSMDIGEHPESRMDCIYLFTNAESVRFYRNGTFIKEFRPEDSPYRHLAHGPILIDDYIGDVLMANEGMSKAQAETVKALLNEVALKGLNELPPTAYAAGAKALVRYGMNLQDARALYDKYIGNWGGNVATYRFEAIRDGKVVKEVNKALMTERRLDLRVSSHALTEGKSYDVAAVRIRLLDENGTLLNYANDPIAMRVKGPLEIIGPPVISLNGGMGGTYVRTTGEAGEAKLLLVLPGSPREEITFTISKGTDK
ncbi:MAG: glycoside hydrolase family 2 protein [Mogibacterium sp.]|nr:glycoside hydrolase family 2 protein [Mogibacterium sp.]